MPHVILVTGSRDWVDRAAVRTALDLAGHAHGFDSLVVRHGGCRTGADAFAAEWCRETADLGVKEDPHPVSRADCSTNPGAAGPMRNVRMIALGADECVAFIAPCISRSCRRPGVHGSHGATHCAARAEKAGIPTRRWRA